MNSGVYYYLFSGFKSNIKDCVIFLLLQIVIWNGFTNKRVELCN